MEKQSGLEDLEQFDEQKFAEDCEKEILKSWCARRDSNAGSLAPEGRTGRSPRHPTTAQSRFLSELAHGRLPWTFLDFRQHTEKTRRMTLVRDERLAESARKVLSPELYRRSDPE
jgi:hypothetical protein